MQRLILRFGNTVNASVHWLVYSDDENEIIASGELASPLSLSELKERANCSEVITLVPASDVLLTSVTLPPNANRKVLSAIPFMLEEDICGDINEHFVALGTRLGDEQQVAVISKSKLQHYQSLLSDADIFCQRMYPDALALPDREGQVSLMQLGDELITRFDAHEGLSGEANWLLPLVEAQTRAREQRLLCFSDIAGFSDKQLRDSQLTDGLLTDNQEKQQDDPGDEAFISYDHSELPLLLMLKSLSSSTLNLCQGPFAIKRKGNPHWEKWKVAAVLAGIALCVNIVSKTFELNELKSERAQVNQAIKSTIAQGFPDIGQYRQARAAVERRMAELERSGGNVSMLAMLSQMSNAFSNSGVSPQTLRYDASRTELRMQSVADNFESLERFRRDVQSLGFEVDQGAINNQGDQVVGVIVVKG